MTSNVQPLLIFYTVENNNYRRTAMLMENLWLTGIYIVLALVFSCFSPMGVFLLGVVIITGIYTRNSRYAVFTHLVTSSATCLLMAVFSGAWLGILIYISVLIILTVFSLEHYYKYKNYTPQTVNNINEDLIDNTPSNLPGNIYIDKLAIIIDKDLYNKMESSNE